MNEKSPSNDDLFRFFVLQQQQSAMIHMGKLVHPETGQVERNLEWARLSIDLLGMLEEKTRGNLSPDDERMLVSVLTTLRLNFVEESRRPEPAPPAAETGEQPEPTAPAAGDSGASESSAAGAPKGA